MMSIHSRYRHNVCFALTQLVAILLVCVSGQDDNPVGNTLCACQPSEYEITLDFSLTCDDRTITDSASAGINDTECIVESRGVPSANIADPFPTFVTDIVILELDQNFDPVGRLTYNDTYIDGDIITYTSVLADTTRTLNSTNLPRALQVATTGTNSAGQPLTNTWVVLFTNDCNTYPVFQEGQQIGWSVFTGLDSPPQNYCPVANSGSPISLPASDTPTSFPSDLPSTFPPSDAVTSDAPSTNTPSLPLSDPPSTTPPSDVVTSDAPSTNAPTLPLSDPPSTTPPSDVVTSDRPSTNTPSLPLSDAPSTIAPSDAVTSDAPSTNTPSLPLSDPPSTTPPVTSDAPSTNAPSLPLSDAPSTTPPSDVATSDAPSTNAPSIALSDIITSASPSTIAPTVLASDPPTTTSPTVMVTSDAPTSPAPTSGAPVTSTLEPTTASTTIQPSELLTATPTTESTSFDSDKPTSAPTPSPTYATGRPVISCPPSIMPTSMVENAKGDKMKGKSPRFRKVSRNPTVLYNSYVSDMPSNIASDEPTPKIKEPKMMMTMMKKTKEASDKDKLKAPKNAIDGDTGSPIYIYPTTRSPRTKSPRSKIPIAVVAPSRRPVDKTRPSPATDDEEKQKEDDEDDENDEDEDVMDSKYDDKKMGMKGGMDGKGSRTLRQLGVGPRPTTNPPSIIPSYSPSLLCPEPLL